MGSLTLTKAFATRCYRACFGDSAGSCSGQPPLQAPSTPALRATGYICILQGLQREGEQGTGSLQPESPPLMSARSSLPLNNHHTGTKRREACLQIIYEPRKGKNINEHGVHKSADQASILQLLENNHCHWDQGLEQSYNYSISFNSQKTNEWGNWHLKWFFFFFKK